MRFKEGNCDPQYPSSVIDLYQPVCNESFIKQSTVYHIICQTIMLIRLSAIYHAYEFFYGDDKFNIHTFVLQLAI